MLYEHSNAIDFGFTIVMVGSFLLVEVALVPHLLKKIPLQVRNIEHDCKFKLIFQIVKLS